MGFSRSRPLSAENALISVETGGFLIHPFAIGSQITQAEAYTDEEPTDGPAPEMPSDVPADEHVQQNKSTSNLATTLQSTTIHGRSTAGSRTHLIVSVQSVG